MDDACLATPKHPPALQIPDSSSTVNVRVIDTNTLIYLNPELFWQPKLQGFNGLHAPIYCFLISNGDHHVVFDLGVRRDWQNYTPKIVSLIKATTVITPGSDVASVLDSDRSGLNIRSADIKAVIWSHNHFDHIGDVSTFPPSTELIVGPGVRTASWPGWPRNPDAGLLDSDIQGRTVREIIFDNDNNRDLKIGRFDALDFFGDGSCYLLNAPGHAVGHLCALARTRANPPSFVFMGADACHHPGVLRPTDYLPLPRTITPSPFVHGPTDSAAINAGIDAGVSACPGALLQQFTMGQSPSTPFFSVAQSPLFPDYDAAMDTVRKIQEFDAADNVFVLIAHDLSLRNKIPLFPKTINAWRASNLGVKTRWLFCNDFEPAWHAKTLGEAEGRAADQNMEPESKEPPNRTPICKEK